MSFISIQEVFLINEYEEFCRDIADVRICLVSAHSKNKHFEIINLRHVNITFHIDV